MYEKGQWNMLGRELAVELHARRGTLGQTHLATPNNRGGQTMADIDSTGWTALGREFAAEQAQRKADAHAAGMLRPGTVLTVVASLRSDLIGRNIPLELVTTRLEHLTAAGWQLPADQWLRLAGDTWGEVMRSESAAPSSQSE